jgi:hypothetical protein
MAISTLAYHHARLSSVLHDFEMSAIRFTTMDGSHDLMLRFVLGVMNFTCYPPPIKMRIAATCSRVKRMEAGRLEPFSKAVRQRRELFVFCWNRFESISSVKLCHLRLGGW